MFPSRRQRFLLRRAGRGLVLAAMTLLLLGAVLRVLVGLLEAATLFLLAFGLVVCVLPRGTRRRLHRLGQEAVRTGQRLVDYLERRAAP